MFCNRLVPFGAVEIGAEPQRMQARIERAIGLAQHGIAGDGVQPVVDRAIDAIVGWKIVPGMRGFHFRLQRAQIGDVVVGHPCHREFACQPFQGGHDLEAIAHIVRRQGHDLRTAIGKLNQQPVGRQHAEGFPHRRARDAQALAEFALVQLGARLQPAFDDQGAQPFGRGLRQARSGDGEGRAIHVSGLSLAYCIQNAREQLERLKPCA